MCRSRLVGDRDVGESKEWQLVVQWKRGHDVQAFEGFASHVGRKMREATEAEAEVVQLSDLVGPSGRQAAAAATSMITCRSRAYVVVESASRVLNFLHQLQIIIDEPYVE